VTIVIIRAGARVSSISQNRTPR